MRDKKLELLKEAYKNLQESNGAEASPEASPNVTKLLKAIEQKLAPLADLGFTFKTSNIDIHDGRPFGSIWIAHEDYMGQKIEDASAYINPEQILKMSLKDIISEVIDGIVQDAKDSVGGAW